ncbi:hypothetical protein LWI28_008715 [Acer negundo]|uniref:Uncharacterized protein n=1 Tax=Acer negundo TaxID=4023 RepID=A0AAD5NQ49_ACENE|nr:hypothetical protein LWI28_008715 [Acer negundo]
MLEAMLQQLLEWPPNPNTPNENAPAPINRDGVERVALDRHGGGRLPRAARHVQFEDFNDENSDMDEDRMSNNGGRWQPDDGGQQLWTTTDESARGLVRWTAALDIFVTYGLFSATESRRQEAF